MHALQNKFDPTGRHLLIDVWGAVHLDDPKLMGVVLVNAAEACGATVVGLSMKHFGDGAGVTGFAMLSQSHISVHSWPEYGYAAFDIFVCGNADPYEVMPVLKSAFSPERVRVTECIRGDPSDETSFVTRRF